MELGSQDSECVLPCPWSGRGTGFRNKMQVPHWEFALNFKPLFTPWAITGTPLHLGCPVQVYSF